MGVAPRQIAKRLLSGVLNGADPVAVSRWRRRSGDRESPIPPRALRARVGDPDVNEWIPGGTNVARELEDLLDGHGRPLSSFRSICDFGCGSGRVLSRLRPHAEARLHGMDVDAAAIGWLRAHSEGIDARVNPSRGPAPFEADSFDLVCSISIFTHLNERSQRLWLAEIARLLRPGGLAVLTVLGNELLAAWASGNRPGITAKQRLQLLDAPPLADAGFIFAPEDRTRWNAWRYRGVETDYGLAFWDHEALHAAWSEWFEVVSVVPESINWRQDAVLLTPHGH